MSYSLVIAGSRGLKPTPAQIEHVVRAKYAEHPWLVISGGAPGVDRCAEAWADFFGIHCAPIAALWELYGKSAGHRRNAVMARLGDRLLAFWDGESPGTADMMTQMRRLSKPVHEVVLTVQS